MLAGHGFGAIVAAGAAALLGERCAGLVLVDGGWERVEETTGVDVDEFLRGLDEPPEVLRSMDAWLADRRGFDPASWDADQERAARDAVVETAAGHVVRAVRPHVVEAVVRAMFAYEPARRRWRRVAAPVTALVALGVRRRRRAPRGAAADGGGARGRRRVADPGRRLPVRRPQPDALSARGGLRRDPRGPARYHRLTMTEKPEPQSRDLPENVRRIVDEIENEIGDDDAAGFAPATAWPSPGRTAGSRRRCARSCSRSARTRHGRACAARRTGCTGCTTS